jgi:hypothetical protein
MGLSREGMHRFAPQPILDEPYRTMIVNTPVPTIGALAGSKTGASSMHSVIPLLGRVFLSVMFLLSGAGKPVGFYGVSGLIASVGLPVPHVLALGAMGVDLIGGIMLLLGWKTRWAAAALLISRRPHCSFMSSGLLLRIR